MSQRTLGRGKDDLFGVVEGGGSSLPEIEPQCLEAYRREACCVGVSFISRDPFQRGDAQKRRHRAESLNIGSVVVIEPDTAAVIVKPRIIRQ
jgi:hypothetical protein